MSGLLADNGVAIIDGIYKRGNVAFTRERGPSPFAIDFLDQLQPLIRRNGSTSGVVEELGTGNGRDLVYFAAAGLTTIGYELSESARALTQQRFREEDLEERLVLRGNFADTAGIKPGSLVGVYGVSSLHYYHPLEALALLSQHRQLLQKNGLIGIALKTTGAQRYDGVVEIRSLALTFDFNAAANQICAFIAHGLDGDTTVCGFTYPYLEGSITRWFYTPEQLAALGRLAGLHPVKKDRVVIHSYGNRNQDEEFAYVVFAKHAPDGESR